MVCPSGYEFNPFSNTCFKLVTGAKKSWDDAEADCQASGGDLAVFDTVESIQWLRNLRLTNTSQLTYISSKW